jgi:hypothetical protein
MTRRTLWVLLLFAGLGVYALAPWLRLEFFKMLAFTTADATKVLPQPVDRSQERVRYEMKTHVVASGACSKNWCTYEELKGPERDEIRLPRSITFDFPTPLVTGAFTDGSGIALTMWHKDLSAVDLRPRSQRFLGYDDKRQSMWEQEARPEGDARIAAGDTVVRLTFRNFYHSRGSNIMRGIGPLRTAPACDVTDLGQGLYQYRHRPGYNPRDPGTFHLRCTNTHIELSASPTLGDQSAPYLLVLIGGNGKTEMYAVCTYEKSRCVATRLFENWILVVSYDYKLGPDFLPVYQKIMTLVRSSVIARSYPMPAKDSP